MRKRQRGWFVAYGRGAAGAWHFTLDIGVPTKRAVCGSTGSGKLMPDDMKRSPVLGTCPACRDLWCSITVGAAKRAADETGEAQAVEIPPAVADALGTSGATAVVPGPAAAPPGGAVPHRGWDPGDPGHAGGRGCVNARADMVGALPLGRTGRWTR